MEKLITFQINSYDDKEKLASALINSGYIVGAELERDKVTNALKDWRVDVYKKD